MKSYIRASTGFYVNDKKHGEFQFIDRTGREYTDMYIEGETSASAQIREMN